MGTGPMMDDEFWDQLESRGYAKLGDGWWVRPPGLDSQFPLDGSLGGPVWTVVEHVDGTITVDPSIGVGPGMSEYHGHLRHGAWVSC